MKPNHIPHQPIATQDDSHQAHLVDIKIAQEFEQALEANSLERIRNLLYKVVYLGKEN